MNKLNVDCLKIIFDELETNSLYSCLLVNKEWCNIIVPILWSYSWKDISASKKKFFFNTILSCLPISSKQLLSDNNIKLPSTILLKPPLFNYISFCKSPPTIKELNDIIGMMFENEFNNETKYILEQEIFKLFVDQCKDIKVLWWDNSHPLLSFPGASTCFSQLYITYIDIDFVNSNSLEDMAQICKDLKILVIDKCCQDLPGLISLIDAQRDLEEILFYSYKDRKGTCKELGKALARKVNTIKCLCLESINIIPPSFLTLFTNLKELTISNIEEYDDTSEEIKEIKQYLAILEFPYLQKLKIWLTCYKELAMLILKIKGNIFEIGAGINNKNIKDVGMLIKSIANNCQNIEKLDIYMRHTDFIHIKLLLLNCRNLKLIVVYNVYDDDNNIGDELLDILTKFSPNSLTTIAISGKWKYSFGAFERLFESYRERNSLEFFIIDNIDNAADVTAKFIHITDNHRIIIKRYIIMGVIKLTNIPTLK
ncbi:hypothetical protein C1645_882193 [Glomus cerebriforme]|uniref:F-box domain-containing protein n=1 Tax=Glomus cerebriforme TaxID=658196 RepID=A0A397S4G7_9GLOM|nr:hypothetical protein C1645_882193 [Glomus cerebriforme]